mmetsp:Transcript_21014/g.45814  ORF Transcript_21014/g.45814 Transcript_21014/m.45814 type:complete len:353 (+) Transcript_21014:32-1090(+)
MMTRSAVRRSPRRGIAKKEDSRPTGATTTTTSTPRAKRHKSAPAALASAAVGMGALAAADSCSTASAAVAVVTPCPAFVQSSAGDGSRTSRYFASESGRELFSDPPAATSIPQEKDTKTGKLKRTQSFQPRSSPDTTVHTLILGTHPSVTSLSENQYFGHTQNAFWWIAGDCLGFRRKAGVNAEGKPYKLTEYVRYDESKIIPYDEQLRVMTGKGFAMWDLVKECEREGSLDQNIKNEEPNDIRGFCSNHPSVKRIVLANGGTTCTMFNRYFSDWWLSGELRPGANPESQKAFSKYAKRTDGFRNARIDVISALPVSPAAARYTYEQKRDSWEEYVYSVGLKDHEQTMKGQK